MPELLLPRPLTFLHLLGKLVMLKECQHIHLWFLLQEGLHSHSSTTQAEVEVPKPEDLIKPGSDIPWVHGRIQWCWPSLICYDLLTNRWALG